MQHAQLGKAHEVLLALQGQLTAQQSQLVAQQQRVAELQRQQEAAVLAVLEQTEASKHSMAGMAEHLVGVMEQLSSVRRHAHEEAQVGCGAGGRVLSPFACCSPLPGRLPSLHMPS